VTSIKNTYSNDDPGRPSFHCRPLRLLYHASTATAMPPRPCAPLDPAIAILVVSLSGTVHPEPNFDSTSAPAASTRNFTMSRWPFVATQVSGMCPEISGISTSALGRVFSTKNFTTSRWSFTAAQLSGVCPQLNFESTSAPA